MITEKENLSHLTEKLYNAYSHVKETLYNTGSAMYSHLKENKNAYINIGALYGKYFVGRTISAHHQLNYAPRMFFLWSIAMDMIILGSRLKKDKVHPKALFFEQMAIHDFYTMMQLTYDGLKKRRKKSGQQLNLFPTNKHKLKS